MTMLATMPEFTLFGGPLQRLGRRLGLVRGTNTFRLGIALGLTAWGVLAALPLLQGFGGKVFSLSVIGIHARFLIAIPLFFLCETWVAPRMAEFVRDLVGAGLVPESERSALDAAIRRVGRLKDPWLAEVIFLLAVVAFRFAEPVLALQGLTGNWDQLRVAVEGGGGAMLGWYLWFCLPLFRFLMLRWLWHLGLWCYFLWRVQRLKLHLVPTHPDRAAGLGYLEVVHEQFTALIAAISVVLAAAAAESLHAGTTAFEALYVQIPMVLVSVLLVFVGPLFLFAPKLWTCRTTGWSAYMRMASRYAAAFDRKWIGDASATGESQLGAADLQSLADLGNSVNVVRGMNIIPASRRLILTLMASSVIPALPLVTFKYPIKEVAAKLFQSLTGL